MEWTDHFYDRDKQARKNKLVDLLNLNLQANKTKNMVLFSSFSKVKLFFPINTSMDYVIVVFHIESKYNSVVST